MREIQSINILYHRGSFNKPDNIDKLTTSPPKVNEERYSLQST